MTKMLLVLTFLTSLVTVRAQSRSELTVYQKLTSTNVSLAASAMDGVLKNAPEYSGAALFIASGVAFREHRIEDAGFLFYVAKFRAEFDIALFPPTGTGSNNPMVAFGALNQELGSSINPAVMAEPKVFARILARVKTWSPVLAPNYDPGWPFAKKGDEKQARAALQAEIKNFMGGMGGLCTLLQDSRYFAAFKVMQAYNLHNGATQPSQEAYDGAVQTILAIEKEKGIQAFTPVLKK